jgi:hypothetical protein
MCAVAVACGDQVVFRNGDKLTGTIKSADNGKIVIETPMAGTVTADIATSARSPRTTPSRFSSKAAKR